MTARDIAVTLFVFAGIMAVLTFMDTVHVVVLRVSK